MERVVCIPVEQYELMVEEYDKVIRQIQEMRELLEGSRKEGKPVKEEVSYDENQGEDQCGVR